MRAGSMPRRPAVLWRELAAAGHARLAGVIDDACLRRIRAAIAPHYAEAGRLRRGDGGPAGATAMPGFVATASSFALDAVLGPALRAQILTRLAAGPLMALLAEALGRDLAVDLDAAWVRRQYPPGACPPLHLPHGWHQDGALGADLLAAGAAPAAQDLLPLVTCWISLTASGRQAPGLELVARPVAGLVALAGLADEALRRRYPPSAFRRPALAAGDALVFPGGTIHRTHVTPAMQRSRSSLELRFFAAGAAPLRLRHHRFVAIAAP